MIRGQGLTLLLVKKLCNCGRDNSSMLKTRKVSLLHTMALNPKYKNPPSNFHRFYRIPSIFTNFHQFPLISTNYHEVPSISLILTGFHRYPPIYTDINLFPLMYTDFHRFPSISTAYHHISRITANI